MPELPYDLLDALRGAERVVALTGSGVSAESGVPTFREAQTGLWERFDPQELATPEAFARDPRLVWEWYEWRRELVERAEPNAGHLALAELERLLPAFTLITQNVDGLHQRGGSGEVIELHGNILRSKCSLEAPLWTTTTPPNGSLPVRVAALRCGQTWCGSGKRCLWRRSRRPPKPPARVICSCL